MHFYMPTKVYQENDCVKNHAAELTALGTRAMVITGRRSAKVNGSFGDVAAVLDDAHLPFVLFDEIEENPSVESVMKARDLAVSEGCDLFIGIGGGSPMDAAKAISLMAYHKDQDASYLYAADTDDTAYPIVAVPTTCGTGSEVTAISVLTIHEQQTKKGLPHKLFPVLSLVDPKYLMAAPVPVLHSTAMDALCHLAESYVNSKATDYSRMCADAGLRAWKRSKSLLKKERKLETLDEAEALMFASSLAGMAIAHTGTSLPHGLSYGLTYTLGTPHGKACGRFLPGYLAAASVEDRSHVLELAGFHDLKELKEFLAESCGCEDIPDDLRQHIVEQLAPNTERLKVAPFPVDPSVLYQIIDF